MLGAATITGTCYIRLSRTQRDSHNLTEDSNTRLARVETKLDGLAVSFTDHTADDARNFRDLRNVFHPKKRFGLGLLGLLLKLFL